MKRSGLLFLALLLMGGAAHAEPLAGEFDRTGRLDLGIEGGGAFVDAESIDDNGWIQANASWGVNDWLAIGVSSGWTETDNDFGGQTGIAEVMGDIIVRWQHHPWNQNLVPYGVLGLGSMWSYAEVDGQDDADDSTFAWKLGGGLDWWINNNWILNFEVAYHDATDDLPVNHLRTQDDSIGFTTVTGGLKFVF